jgi:hypothetical protein
MNATPAQSALETRDARPGRALARPEADGLVQGLERLRDGLLERLDRIEAMAADQSALLDIDSSERERLFRDRLSVLEAAHARLLAESRRREQEWQDVLKQLEADRLLLADAWERLEQAQVNDEPRANALSQAAPISVKAPQPVAAAVAAGPPSDDYDDPVTRNVLRQFQALSQDVRRNTRGKLGR